MAKLIVSYQHSALYSTIGLHRRIQLPAMGQARPCSLSFGTQHNRHIKGLAPWMPRTLNRHRQIETLRFPCRLYPWPGTLETCTLQTFPIIPQPLKCRLNSTSAQGNRQWRRRYFQATCFRHGHICQPKSGRRATMQGQRMCRGSESGR
jgi:hypothetical protein